MIRFDYQYVAGWSLARDVEILLSTLPASCRAAAHTDRLLIVSTSRPASLDEGPADEAAALALARAASLDGTHTIVATPRRSRRWPTEPAAIRGGSHGDGQLYERDAMDVELLPGGEVRSRWRRGSTMRRSSRCGWAGAPI